MVITTLTENDIRNIVQEEIAKIEFPINGKKKRKPSQWNIFLGECVPKQPKDKSLGEKAKACAIEYNQSKGKREMDELNKKLKGEMEI